MGVSAADPIQVHFLHIGKNAGTQITHLAQQLRPHGVILNRERHETRLVKLPRGSQYIFSIRDPVTRFRSGFYSRLRKGQPRVLREWSRHEAVAFEAFQHANDLAEALFDDGEAGRAALQAITSIQHVCSHQIDWFARRGHFGVRPPLWIIRQEHFDMDFDTMMERLGLSVRLADLEVAEDDVLAHRNDYTGRPPLSDRAVENLRRWYARDLQFYRHCEAWMAAERAKA